MAISPGSVVNYCTLSRSRISVNCGRPGAALPKDAIVIDQAGTDGDADQVGGARHAELCLDPAASVRHGLVADTYRVGDLRQSAASGQLAQDLDIPRGQILERIRRRTDARKDQSLGNFALYVGATAG